MGQKLDLGFEISNTYYMVDPRYCKFNFYRTLKPNPIFTFENGIEKIGECDIDAGKDYPKFPKILREVKVTMKLGGTYIDVKAVHKSSGNEIKTMLQFDK